MKYVITKPNSPISNRHPRLILPRHKPRRRQPHLPIIPRTQIRLRQDIKIQQRRHIRIRNRLELGLHRHNLNGLPVGVISDKYRILLGCRNACGYGSEYEVRFWVKKMDEQDLSEIRNPRAKKAFALCMVVRTEEGTRTWHKYPQQRRKKQYRNSNSRHICPCSILNNGISVQLQFLSLWERICRLNLLQRCANSCILASAPHHP